MKTLFIAQRHDVCCGGAVCSLRNLRMLRALQGDGNVVEFRVARNSAFKDACKPLWLLKGFWTDVSMCSVGGLDRKQEDSIMEIVEKQRIGLVFLDSSAFGNLAKKIKERFADIRVVTFFHNVEYWYLKQEHKLLRVPWLKYRCRIVRKNEENACRYSDKIIALNRRDQDLIKAVYGRDADAVIPISLKDKYSPKADGATVSEDRKVGLFVGSYFSMNVEGILFFAREVLPFVDMKLLVVGAGMSRLRAQIGESDKIELHDYVESLDAYYEQADFAVIPILSGGGMKVKTAEALMYGKYVIGTPEAFVGYERTDEVGTICSDSQQFVDEISGYHRKSKYNALSRDWFLRNFSDDAVFAKFRAVLDF